MPTPLNDCGCCEGITAIVPEPLRNRPGLGQVSYRIGTHGDFLASALAALSDPQFAALRSLTTRDSDDFTIALLDGWATLADVLTFYQERIANELWLRTATERDSILRLAQLIGYRLKAGVAAEAPLAFLLDETPGAPSEVTIKVGSKVQSVPGADEKAQTFETIEEIEARTGWGILKPQLTAPPLIANGAKQAYLKGVDTQLQPGDALAFVGNARENDKNSTLWEFRFLQSVTAFPEKNYTLVTWKDVFTKFPIPLGTSGLKVFALRQRAAFFGNNAPAWLTMPSSVRRAYGDTHLDFTEWPNFKVQNNQIDLDAVYPKVVTDSWVVLTKPFYVQLHKAVSVTSVSRAEFALSAKITRITPDRDLTLLPLRSTTAHIQSEQLTLADVPVINLVIGNSVTLNSKVDGLTEGRLLLFSGVSAITGSPLSELVEITKVEISAGLTKVTFAPLVPSFPKVYRRDNLLIYGNVAPATHGETVSEVLGSGDGAQPNQTFKLRQAPALTYIRSTAPGGAESTLQIRVNDLLWHEVPTLYQRGPRERIFTTELADDGSVTVRFGDGEHGARLPSGSQNVKATYRRGSGLEGLVRAGQLTTLLTRPPGLKSAINPIAAEGADEPESFANAQQNAPLTVLTLERVVSLEDYENFSRCYAGIAKTLATWTWDGRTRGVFVTVAGPLGAAVSTPLAGDLITAIHNAGDPFVPVRVASYEEALFKVAGKIKIDPDYESEKVVTAAQDALRNAFSFTNRQFGQPVVLSEVIALVQGVAGVVAVDLDSLYRTGTPLKLNARLEANLPNGGDPASLGAAELLTIDPEPFELEVMS
ncbi:MAG TPA: putative baseplate assembly protein [Chthoniobacterales bacterium]|nr:putative baseplate assembly protein [Chthoniobacterales bacterium]